MLTIKETDRAKALAALYNASQPQGLGLRHYTPEDMTEAQADARLAEGLNVDYLQGRVIKVNFRSTEIDTRKFDRDNGHGAGEAALRGAGLI